MKNKDENHDDNDEIKYLLHAPSKSFHSFKIIIAAKYNNVIIRIPDTLDVAYIARKSPIGKGPLLVLPNEKDVIFGSNTIARYIAKIGNNSGIMGKSSMQSAVIDSWIDWCVTRLEVPVCIWWYPVAGYTSYHQAAFEMAKTDVTTALTTLNNWLKGKTYLVGDQITLADITIISTLVYPMKLVFYSCDKFMKPFESVVRWFRYCINLPQFQAIQTSSCVEEVLP